MDAIVWAFYWCKVWLSPSEGHLLGSILKSLKVLSYALDACSFLLDKVYFSLHREQSL